MSKSNPFLWPKPRLVWGYGIAVLSVSGALVISRAPGLHLESAPVSLFLCAVMLSAWFGGIGPGLLATTLSDLSFYYYFLAPMYSLAAKPGEIPRLVIFTVSALFVGLLSAAQRSAAESLRRARDDLRGTVEELQKTNSALDSESRERKHAEEATRQMQVELTRVSRVTTMGELTASLAHEVNQPIAAAVTDASTCLRWLMREPPDLTEAREAASRVAKDATRAAEIVSRVRQLFKKSTPQRELINVNEVVREMIALVRSEATRYDILLETDLDRHSPGHWRPRAIAAGADEPLDEQHRRDEKYRRYAETHDQVATGKRAGFRVRQRYRSRTPAGAGGPDLYCVLYHQASRHRHGTSHQPFHH